MDMLSYHNIGWQGKQPQRPQKDKDATLFAHVIFYGQTMNAYLPVIRPLRAITTYTHSILVSSSAQPRSHGATSLMIFSVFSRYDSFECRSDRSHCCGLNRWCYSAMLLDRFGDRMYPAYVQILVPVLSQC